MFKNLIICGCSYSIELGEPFHYETWPSLLTRYFPKMVYKFPAHIGVGNGYISRTVLYNVSESLKNFESNEILVGVVWSGISRKEVYHTDKLPINVWVGHDGINNPCKIVKDYKWNLIHEAMDNDVSKSVYKYDNDVIHHTLSSYEHILRTQLYLDKHNINYFMGVALDNTIMSGPDHYLNTHEEIKYTYDQINLDNFIPVSSMFDWGKQNNYLQEDGHLSIEGTKKFLKTQIVPYLISKGYILNK